MPTQDTNYFGRRARHRMMALLERWDTSADPRARFAHRWATAAENINAAAVRGQFLDYEWVLALLDLVGDYYFTTVEPDGDDLSLVTAPAWHAAHDFAGRRPRRPHVAVLLAYNAVICNDLPQAVGDMIGVEWPVSTTLLQQRAQDIRAVGDLIAATMGSDACIARAWFADAWVQALALATAADDLWRDVIRDDIELTALRRAHLIACDVGCAKRVVALRERDLDRLFPVRHDDADCRLSVRLPAWGVAAPTVS